MKFKAPFRAGAYRPLQRILALALALGLAVGVLPGRPASASTEVAQTVYSSYDGLNGAAGYDTKLYQSIYITSANQTIKTFSMYMFKDAGTTGTATVKLYSTSGRTDTAGTLLYSTSLDVSTLTTSLVWYTWTVPAGGVYFTTRDIKFGFEYSGGDAAHKVYWGQSTSTYVGYPPSYAATHSYRGGAWSSQTYLSGYYGDMDWKYTYDTGDTTDAGGSTPGGAEVYTITSGSGTDSTMLLSAAYINDTGGNVTATGFQVGTASGVYSTANLTQAVSTNATDGTFDDTVTGLTPGVLYIWRAMVEADGTWYYGSELSFTIWPPPGVTTGAAAYINGASSQMWELHGSTSVTGWTGNLTQTILIGRSDGVWQANAGIQGLAGSEEGPPGAYVRVATGLLPNTTYFYAAYAYYEVDLWTLEYAVGSTGNFTTGAGGAIEFVPEVSTVSAVWNTTTLTYTFTGNVAFTALPIVNHGFTYGILALTANVTGVGAGVYGMGGTWSLESPVFAPGDIVIYQAWATDSAGNTGYGSILNVHVPEAGAGATVSMISATPSGTNVALVGSLVSIGSVDVTLEGFAWSTTNNVTEATQHWTAAASYSVGQFTWTQSGLAPSTTYYFWAGVYAGSWVWSTPTQATTGANSGIVTILAPRVVTGDASSATATSFNGTLEITNTGGGGLAFVSTYGLDVGTISGVYTDSLRAPSGNYSAGDYWLLATSADWYAGLVVYYRAVAVNQYGPAVGNEKAVILTAATGPPTTVDTPEGTGTDFRNRLRAMMVGLGMDNSTGHWAFMFLWMGGASIVFIICMIAARKSRAALICLGVALVIVLISIFGIFTFSGLLGMWPVFILVFTAAALAVGVIAWFAGLGRQHG